MNDRKNIKKTLVKILRSGWFGGVVAYFIRSVWGCFNVNFNILLKQFYCASVGK